MQFAATYYVKNGSPTTEIDIIKSALRPLRSLYGTTPSDEFGPLRVKAVREEMIRSDLCRNEINKRVGRIKRCFKWGVENEIVAPSIHHALQAVAGLRRGRCGVRESEPVRPVEEWRVNATLPHLSRQVRDMVRLQLLCGCRPAEICILRPSDVDTSGDVWIYRPETHKTEHHGRERVICFGPRAQEILNPWLENRAAEAYCFSPAEAEAERDAAKRANRKSPMTPSQRARQTKADRKRPWRESYDTNTYRRAIHRASEIAFGMPPELRQIDRDLPDDEKERRTAEAKAWRTEHLWSPNQLRHASATAIRKTYGIESAQLALGHADANVTQIYRPDEPAL